MSELFSQKILSTHPQLVLSRFLQSLATVIGSVLFEMKKNICVGFFTSNNLWQRSSAFFCCHHAKFSQCIGSEKQVVLGAANISVHTFKIIIIYLFLFFS